MAEEKHHGFIIEETEAASESMADLPQNRTLMIEQLTYDEPPTPEITYGLQNIDDVFKHYKPSCEIELEDDEGGSAKQNFEFNGLGDFGQQGLIDKSDLLKSQKSQKDDYLDIARKMQSNRVLQKVLADESAKADFVEALKAMLDELG
ncbi:MAG: hypothetical protein R2728_05125 [Chitinophagales bacterium]